MIRLAKSGYGVKWNQLIQNGDFSNGTTNWSVNSNPTKYSVVDGKLRVEISSSGIPFTRNYQTITCVIGHKYLLIGSGYSTVENWACKIYFDTTNSANYPANILNFTTIRSMTTLMNIYTATAATMYVGVNIQYKETEGYAEFDNIMFIDLTDAFGAGYEPTVEQFKAMYFESYYDYVLSQWQRSKNYVTAYPTPVIENGTTLLPIENHVVGILHDELPAGYRQVEYIYQEKGASGGTTGLAFIQSNLSFADIDTVEFDIAIFSDGGAQQNIVLCAYNTSYYIVVDRTARRVNGFSSATFTPNSTTLFSDGQRHTLIVSGLLSSDTTKIRTAWDWAWWHKTYWYGLKLYKNGILLQNFTPCIRASDNKAGLYDTVNSTFYGNAGAGEFLYNDVLPPGYVRLDYIESTSGYSQYIDTGYTPKTSTRIELYGQYTERLDSAQGIPANYRSAFGSGAGSQGFYFGVANENLYSTVVGDLNYHKFFIDFTNWTYGFDNNIYNKTSATYTPTATFWVFCRYGGTSGTNKVNFKCYNLKFYENGTLVHNYLPCYRCSDGEEGLYDTVAKQFFNNQGTGKFVRGNVINNIKPVYNYLRRSLPVGYVELEYLESTGTQWIDTGVNGDSTSYITYKFQYTSLSTDYNRVFGSRKNTQSLLNMRSSTATGGSFFLEWGGGNYTGPSIDTNVHEVILDGPNNQYKFDGALKSSGFNISDNNTYNLYIFGTNNGGSNGSKRFYWYKHYKSGALIRNYIPCYRYSDGVEGLYDTVTKQFFTNQGTGRFIRGDIVVGKELIGNALRHKLATEKNIDYNKTAWLDLELLNYEYDSSRKVFYSTSQTNMKGVDSNAKVFNGACAIYTVSSVNGIRYDMSGINMGIALGYITASNQLAIRNDTYTNATTFKNAMKNVLLAYELA